MRGGARDDGEAMGTSMGRNVVRMMAGLAVVLVAAGVLALGVAVVGAVSPRVRGGHVHGWGVGGGGGGGDGGAGDCVDGCTPGGDGASGR